MATKNPSDRLTDLVRRCDRVSAQLGAAHDTGSGAPTQALTPPSVAERISKLTARYEDASASIFRYRIAMTLKRLELVSLKLQGGAPAASASPSPLPVRTGSSPAETAATVRKCIDNLQRTCNTLQTLVSERKKLPTTVCPSAAPIVPRCDSSYDAFMKRMHLACIEEGLTKVKLKRVSPEYYDNPLESRRDELGALSTDHLCKSMIFENKSYDEKLAEKGSWYSRYCCVVLQYTARVATPKLERFVWSMNKAFSNRKGYKFELAPEDVSAELTGYIRNAVTPVGMITPMPIVLAAPIAALASGYFWLGGGEINLKLELQVEEFTKLSHVVTGDVTIPRDDED